MEFDNNGSDHCFYLPDIYVLITNRLISLLLQDEFNFLTVSFVYLYAGKPLSASH